MGACARLLRFSLLWLSLLWALLAAPLAAQEASILVVDLDRAYETSLFGKSMRAQFREDNQDVAAENTLLLNALKDEELQLTEDRTTLSAAEFAAAAAAFDAKVQEIRSARLEKIRQVDEQFKNLKPLFFSRIAGRTIPNLPTADGQVRSRRATRHEACCSEDSVRTHDRDRVHVGGPLVGRLPEARSSRRMFLGWQGLSCWSEVRACCPPLEGPWLVRHILCNSLEAGVAVLRAFAT